MIDKLKIIIAGEPFEAELYIDKAPKTISALESVLPLEAAVNHASWSGYNLFSIFRTGDLKAKFELENETIYGSYGEVLWKAGPEIHEFFVAYAQAQYRDPAGPMASNLIGIIRDRKRLYDLGVKIRQQGGLMDRKLKIEKA